LLGGGVRVKSGHLGVWAGGGQKVQRKPTLGTQELEERVHLRLGSLKHLKKQMPAGLAVPKRALDATRLLKMRQKAILAGLRAQNPS
jgi:hypothetical protein